MAKLYIVKTHQGLEVKPFFTANTEAQLLGTIECPQDNVFLLEGLTCPPLCWLPEGFWGEDGISPEKFTDLRLKLDLGSSENGTDSSIPSSVGALVPKSRGRPSRKPANAAEAKHQEYHRKYNMEYRLGLRRRKVSIAPPPPMIRDNPGAPLYDGDEIQARIQRLREEEGGDDQSS